LRAVIPVQPPWLLAGRSALWKLPPDRVPVTDLDLAWHGVVQLGSLSREVRGRLTAAGLEVTTIQSGSSVLRLLVAAGPLTCTLTLAAEPEPPLACPWRATLKGLSFEVESPHQIFVDRLCALLDRPDPRDLADVQRLMKSGEVHLEKALVDSPRKLRGFSPLWLAWILRNFRIAEPGFDAGEAERLTSFKERLVLQIVTSCFPDPVVS
jgi:hypothetical protein